MSPALVFVIIDFELLMHLLDNIPQYRSYKINGVFSIFNSALQQLGKLGIEAYKLFTLS